MKTKGISRLAEIRHLERRISDIEKKHNQSIDDSILCHALIKDLIKLYKQELAYRGNQ